MNATERKAMRKVKKDIRSAINEIAKQCPEMTDHLRKHIVFNDQKGTVRYTGDIQWNTGF